MRVLKLFAIFMAVLLAVALLVVGYFFATAHVSIAAFGATTIPASQDVQRFEAIRTALHEDTFLGTVYAGGLLGEAPDYAFITYTLRINNQCLVPITMVEVQIVPDPSDVVQLFPDETLSLDPKAQGKITATILTKGGSHSARELIVTYYVWGTSFAISEVYQSGP